MIGKLRPARAQRRLEGQGGDRDIEVLSDICPVLQQIDPL
jgi:hypothetical protein